MHGAFVGFAESMLPDGTKRNLFRRMARQSAIEHRFSFQQPMATTDGSWRDADGLYVKGNFPSTARRMKAFEQFAPTLARAALDKQSLTEEERYGITHVIVTSCTGLYAPGLDYEVVGYLELDPSVERTMIGFMGCYASINALKAARHIVRSEPDGRVLLLSLELCSLHMQETQDHEQLLAFLVFADGCAAYLVSAQPQGLAIDSFLSLSIPATNHLITWRIGEQGFDMQLSGKVPAELRNAVGACGSQITRGMSIDLWAVHPGGRTILDAVEQGLGLRAEALSDSRGILLNYGNMSSATVMFVLQQIMQRARPAQQGCAMSFGPGLTAETLLFHAV